MQPFPWMLRWARHGARASLLLLLASPAEADLRRVVVLQSFDRGNLILDEFTATLRAQVNARLPEPVTFTEFTVNPAGFDPAPERATVDYLRSAFAGRPKPDLLITSGGPAAQFARKYRAELFPDVPLLYAAVDQRFVQGLSFTDQETAVAVANDPAEIIADILRLLPATQHVFIVLGESALGRFWREEFARESVRFPRQVQLIWADGMTYAAMLDRASTLPPRSAIYVHSFEVDGEGATYAKARVLADLRARARAPLFGSQSPELGFGVVGGNLMSIDEVARRTTDAALRILGGTTPARVETVIQQPGPYIFDWRELQRFGIGEDRLPAGSVVRFREPGVWERYRSAIVGAASALVAQALLIAALLVNRVKRRRAEQSLRESEGRFRVLANAAPVMIRISGIDALATDFNVPWSTFTGRDLEQERGHGWSDGIHPDDVRCLETYRQAFERREPYRIEYRLRRADGEYRWMLDSGQPRFMPDGAFAGYIGSAIDISELRAARATLSSLNRRLIEAQEQERSLVARELHDDICQQLTVLTWDLHRLNNAIPASETEARRRAKALHDEVTLLAEHVNSMSHRLHSPKLELFELATVAGMFCRDIATRHGVTVEFVHHEVPETLPEGVAHNVFRVLQEALSNGVKHSGASRYRVSLCGTDDRLLLEVRDDGCGFDPAAAIAKSGLGLVTMQERLTLLHGDVRIESTQGSGTRVVASVPLRPNVVVPVEHGSAA